MHILIPESPKLRCLSTQLAYTYLSFANATLNDLLASSTPRTDAERYARRSKRGPPLPPPLFCKGPACAGRPRCALAAPAARETLAVADLVSNATARAREAKRAF